MNKKLLLDEYFKENKLMQLATVEDGRPWLCNLYFVTDENNNIYWLSTRTRRHSKEILSNPAAAITIVHDSENKQALQITGNAYEVPLDDAERVDKLYRAKFGNKSMLTEILSDTSDRLAYWVVKPETIAFWDEVNFPDTPKQVFK